MEIEPEMLAMETIVPVYFAVEDEELLSIYEQTRAASASQGSASAAEGEFWQVGERFRGRQAWSHLWEQSAVSYAPWTSVLLPSCLFCLC